MAEPAYSVQRYFPVGMDSWTVPDQLGDGEYQFGLNSANRGGIVQTRPGSVVHACLPDGRLQGLTSFTPSNGTPHLVAAVDGLIYVAPSPFHKWRQLPDIQFSASSRFISWANCLKSSDYTVDGRLFYLDTPYQVLVMQDGRTRAAFWDGGESRHLNPTEIEGEITADGYDETKIGLWQAWSGKRLWVAKGNKVYASDIENPLKFTESEYLNEAPAFFLPSECTGMCDFPEMQGLLVFHRNGVEFFESSILERTQWLQTANMQRTVAYVGCVAPRSIVKQYGYVYWFSPGGLVSIDDAYRTNQSSRLDVMDQEMAWSKAYIGPDIEGVAGVAFENYLLESVPFCSIYNSHTWAMDQAVFEGRLNAWNGVWTGWRPVEWTVAEVDGRRRCFFASRDVDGGNRVWEAFTADRKDNGCAITCSAQFKMDGHGSASVKQFGYSEIDMAQIVGNVSVMAAIGSWKGWFQRVLTKEIVSTNVRVTASGTYGDGTNYPVLGSNRPQVRTLRTQTWKYLAAHNQACIESDSWPTVVNYDRAFQMVIAWSGVAGVLGIRSYGTAEPSPNSGDCEADETGPRHLTNQGVSSKAANPSTTDPFPVLTGTGSATNSLIYSTEPDIAIEATVAATASSQISQDDADRKAACFANQQLSITLHNTDIPSGVYEGHQVSVEVIQHYWNDEQTATASCGYGSGATSTVTIPANTYDSPTSQAEADALAMAAATAQAIADISYPQLGVFDEAGNVRIGDSIDFGIVTGDEDITVTLKNEGCATLNLIDINITGTGFSLVTPLAVAYLDPGQTTQITLRYSSP